MKAKHRRHPALMNSIRRFLTQRDLGEIRWAIGVANSRARRAGKVPKPPKIVVCGCRCNCFHVIVD